MLPVVAMVAGKALSFLKETNQLTKFLKYLAESIHLDDLRPTNIDRAQEGHIFHPSFSPEPYFTSSFSIRRSGTSHMIATVTYRASAIIGETNAKGTAAV